MHNDLEALGGVETPTTKHFWDWVKRTFSPSYQTEVEAYMKDCVDHADVERKMQYLSRRGMI